MTVRVGFLLAVLGLAPLSGCPRTAAPECLGDSDCGSEVCARDGNCLPASAVQSVKVRWTLGGEPAGVARCEGHEDFFVHFEGPNPGETIGFAPVPCRTGQFSIDKLPTSYETVEVGVEGGASEIIRLSGPEVVVDLPL